MSNMQLYDIKFRKSVLEASGVKTEGANRDKEHGIHVPITHGCRDWLGFIELVLYIQETFIRLEVFVYLMRGGFL